MKVLHLSAAALLAWGGFAAFNVASATTYYVRTDGGNASQCNGTADKAYPGSGSNVACAWNHPFVALPPTNTNSPQAPRIHGGDTLVIDAGSYQMGADWKDNSSRYGACSLNAPWGCMMQPVPSGTSSNPTRIVGAGWDSGCKAPPELWGSDRTYEILNLDGSSNVVVACLNVTDHSACIEYHVSSSVACNRNTAPYGPWAHMGLHAQDSSNVTLQDVNIHGLANMGIQAGRLSNWTLTNVKIVANGGAGWSGDLGNGQNSSNSGNMNFTNVEVGWNGCTEQYPNTTIYACWGQQEGGYGDGLGTATTGGNWTFNEVNFHDNTQDGLDLRYANGTGKVTVLRSHFSGNAGNQVKTQGPTVIQNSVIVGNCANFNGKYYMSSGDNCRANGTAVYMVTSPGALASLSYNTIIGQGDCLIGPDEGTSTSEVDVYNNVLIGEPLWNDSSKKSCMFWWGNPPTGTVKIQGNVVWNTRYYTTYPSGNIYEDPKLTSENMSTFNPMPLSGSPAVDKGSTVITVTTDFAGDKRPVGAGYDVGAMEYGSSPVTPPPTNPPPTNPPPPTKPPRRWRTGGAEPPRLIGSKTSASEPARQVSTSQTSAAKATTAPQKQEYSLGDAFRHWLGLETAAR